jgi:two-component system sensor histidine kinase/response regulator
MDTKEALIESLQSIDNEDFVKNLLTTVRQFNEGKNIFDTLKQTQEELQSQLIQKEKFFNIVSYELGSPLNSLKSMADFVMMDVATIEDNMVVESVKMLYAQIEKIQLQMGNLIAWSNLAINNYSFQPELLDVREVVEKAHENYQKLAHTKSVQLACATMPEALYVKADVQFLQLVVNNLVSNAVKFSRKNDSVEISAVKTSHQTVQITIKDTGIGMGKAKLENLFNPARKATQKGTANENGYGIGLLTAKAILTLHQTELVAQSEQGSGSTFSFELPAE